MAPVLGPRPEKRESVCKDTNQKAAPKTTPKNTKKTCYSRGAGQPGCCDKAIAPAWLLRGYAVPRTSSGTSSWQGICAGLAPPSLRSSLPWRCDCDSHGLQLPLQLKRPLLWRRGGVQPRRAQLSTCAWRARTALRCEATSAAGRPRPSKPPASASTCSSPAGSGLRKTCAIYTFYLSSLCACHYVYTGLIFWFVCLACVEC